MFGLWLTLPRRHNLVLLSLGTPNLRRDVPPNCDLYLSAARRPATRYTTHVALAFNLHRSSSLAARPYDHLVVTNEHIHAVEIATNITLYIGPASTVWRYRKRTLDVHMQDFVDAKSC